MTRQTPHVPTDVSTETHGERQVRLYLPILALVVAVLLWAVPSSPLPPSPAEISAAASVQPGIRSIVLDPGHGGLATGTIGAGGVSEKDVTLDIAVRLREMIYRRIGLQVFLTREEDDDVPLDQRTEKANNWAGDLFVSIHANGYRSRAVRGPETYFLSANASDQIAQSAATSENSAAPDSTRGSSQIEEGAATPAPLEFILWDLAQTQHLRESSLFAETVQAGLNDLWQLHDRGVKQAPFRVLKGTTMPAILVEVGYLSNAQDAALLSDPAFRQQIAESLFNSISIFRERFAVLNGAPPEPTPNAHGQP